MKKRYFEYLEEFSFDEGQTYLKHPETGDEYNEYNGVEVGDSDQVRGQCVKVKMLTECDEIPWSFCVGFHKGRVMLFAEIEE